MRIIQTKKRVKSGAPSEKWGSLQNQWKYGPPPPTSGGYHKSLLLVFILTVVSHHEGMMRNPFQIFFCYCSLAQHGKKWHISIFTRCSFRGSANWDMRCRSSWAFTSWPKYIWLMICEASNKPNCGCLTIGTIPGYWIVHFSISLAFIFRQYMNISTWAIWTTTFTNYVTYSKLFWVTLGVIYQISLEYEHFTNFLSFDIYFGQSDQKKHFWWHIIVIQVATQKFVAFLKKK